MLALAIMPLLTLAVTAPADVLKVQTPPLQEASDSVLSLRDPHPARTSTPSNTSPLNPA